MYTDWTAIALLLFTAVPLLVVVGTATLFVLRNKEKAPWADPTSAGPPRKHSRTIHNGITEPTAAQ